MRTMNEGPSTHHEQAYNTPTNEVMGQQHNEHANARATHRTTTRSAANPHSAPAVWLLDHPASPTDDPAFSLHCPVRLRSAPPIFTTGNSPLGDADHNSVALDAVTTSIMAGIHLEDIAASSHGNPSFSPAVATSLGDIAASSHDDPSIMLAADTATRFAAGISLGDIPVSAHNNPSVRLKPDTATIAPGIHPGDIPASAPNHPAAGICLGDIAASTHDNPLVTLQADISLGDIAASSHSSPSVTLKADLANVQLTTRRNQLPCPRLAYSASVHDNWDSPSVTLEADTATLVAGTTPLVMLIADTTHRGINPFAAHFNSSSVPLSLTLPPMPVPPGEPCPATRPPSLLFGGDVAHVDKHIDDERMNNKQMNKQMNEQPKRMNEQMNIQTNTPRSEQITD